MPGQDGTHELKVVFHATGSGDFPALHVSPASAASPGIGIQFQESPFSTASTVYVGSVGWS